MGTEETKDPLKGVDWKAVGTDLQKDPGSKPVIRKRLPKKIRQIPECYFLPRRSLPSALAFYGACIAGGIGAGMLLEIWINKKVKATLNSYGSQPLPLTGFELASGASQAIHVVTMVRSFMGPIDHTALRTLPGSSVVVPETSSGLIDCKGGDAIPPASNISRIHFGLKLWTRLLRY
ncbi:hypothetical protein FNV43_RR20595 [Rhamnella rubrinervis]|uniref:Uncharacterized protein n=1 Tax=Rhamnella rubrinervis TaxID=2594499 RepID=A0A8K0E1F7_9ROSA|nr:hypothetical protein FNV43_RR20595 [Rhamnella rubrinervis]